MQIICPTCSTAYDVQPGALGESGRSVRCARCRTVWLATSVAEPAPAEAPVAAVDIDWPIEEPSPGAADPALAKQGTPSGEFDWSIDAPKADDETPAPEQDGASAGPGAADENAAQAAADAAFLAEPDPIAEAEAPPLVPGPEPVKPPAVEHHAPDPENIETIAARRARQQAKGKWHLPKLHWPKWHWPKWKRRLPRPGLPAVTVALVASLAALLVWRSDVVRMVPQSASLFGAVGLPVNVRGLVFENTRTTGEVQQGMPVLIIEGSILNVTTRTVEVPRLRFAVRNGAGHEVYAWTSVTGRSILAPGERAAFRTRLASPPPDARDVIVRFFNRRDFLAGMH